MHPFFLKLNAIPQPIQDFFMSNDPRLLCEEVCQLYGLPEAVIPAVTKPLGAIFVKDAALSEYPKRISDASGIAAQVAFGVSFEVNKRIFLRFPEYFTDAVKCGKEWETKKSAPVIGLEEAKKKVLEMEPWILEHEDEDQSVSARSGAVFEKISLLPALGKYPKLGEQIVTRERLQLKNQPEPVRPNLTNWLRVYRDELGVGYHDPMTRGKFIFDSVNCKKLSSEERERLNLVLRSIEENMPIDIDPTKMEIVFPEFRTSEKDHPTPRPAVSATPLPATMPPKAVPDAPRPIQRSATFASGAGPVRSLSPSASSETANPGNERPQPRPFVPTPPVLQSPPPAPARRPVSFIPSPPPDLPVGGSFSFSSSHALPVESEEEGGLSIRRPDAASLPSGQVAFGQPASGKVEAVSANLSRDGKNNAIQPTASDMNPFHIHPVSTRGESTDSGFDTGRTVNLRGDK